MAHPLKEKITVTIQLFILHSFLAQMHVVLSSDEIPIDICGNSLASDGQSPLSSTSSSNRETLFSVLTSKASIYKFYNTSVGNASGDTDAGIVYGQFICLNYTRNDACDSCIKQATADITVKCPNSLEVIIWEETCQLRISRVNFFGKLWQQQYKFQKNPENISDPDLLGSLAKETLNDLAEEAAFSLKNDSCATKERNFKLNMNRTLYSLVQCAQDLSTEDCLTCLRGAITEVQNCCSMSLGARVLSPSCYLRYELYPFYDQTETPGW